MRISDWSSDVCSSDLTLALGLMSGTSLDGIDAALLTTDGEKVSSAGGRLTVAYDEGLRARLRSILGSTRRTAEVAAVEAALTHRSEEHTSELQSLMRISYAVFCLKKKTNPTNMEIISL